MVLIADLRFSRVEALGLAALFLAQFLFTSTEVRYLFIALYLILALALMIGGGAERRSMFFALLIGPRAGRGAIRAGSE